MRSVTVGNISIQSTLATNSRFQYPAKGSLKGATHHGVWTKPHGCQWDIVIKERLEVSHNPSQLGAVSAVPSSGLFGPGAAIR